MLRWRLTLGVLLIAALAGLCWLDLQAIVPGTWLWPVALALTFAATGELIAMARLRGLEIAAAPVYIGNALIVAAAWMPVYFFGVSRVVDAFTWPAVSLGVGLLVVFVDEMRRYEAPGGVTQRLALSALALVYVGWLMAFVVGLRMFAHGSYALVPLVSLIIVVKMCDTGAYTVGRLFGRHKMAPKLSPGKTMEGAAGGLFFAVIGAWATFSWFAPQDASYPAFNSTWAWISYGLLVGAAGMAADLAESLLKRDLGAKDSSRWMPGFGGVLDVLDSILLAAPVAYAWWLVTTKIVDRVAV